MDMFGTLLIFVASFSIRYFNIINIGIPLFMIHIGILYQCILLATGPTRTKIFGYHSCVSFIATSKTSTTLDTGLDFNMKILGIKKCLGKLKIHSYIGWLV